MATNYAAGGREMTVGGVLARAFAAIGAAPLRIFGTSLVLSALPYALASAVGRDAIRTSVAAQGGGVPPASPFAGWPWGQIVAVWIVYFVLYLAAKALLIRATVASDGDGRRETLGETAAAGLRALPALAGATILFYLAIWVGMILVIVPGVILALMWAVLAPVLVQERPGVFAAFGRSRRLTAGARLRILGLFVVVLVVYLVFAFALGAAGAGLGLSGAAAAPSVLGSVLTVVIQTAFVAVWTAIQTALYLELRDWKDGVAGDRLADIFA